MTNITEKLNEEIKNAMKSKNEVRLSVIRMLKNKILQVNARGEISEDEAIKLFKAYAKSLKETIDIAKQNGKTDVVNETEAELTIVKEFLPAELTLEQITMVVSHVVEKIGKDKTKMGLIMKESMSALKGQADGNVVKDIVAKLLG